MSEHYQIGEPVIIVRISFVKVMMIPPARVRKPLALCDGSWDLSERPTCTIPKPSRIMPMALIRPKINWLRLFTTVSGSVAGAANTGTAVIDQMAIALVHTSLGILTRSIDNFIRCRLYVFVYLLIVRSPTIRLGQTRKNQNEFDMWVAFFQIG